MWLPILCLAVATITLAMPLSAQSSSKLIAAQFGNDESRALLDLYPTSDVANERSAAAVIKLTIAPNGKVVGCELVDQVGDAGLAGRICRISSRVKWKPARERAGQAAFGVMTTLVRFAIPGTPQGDLVRKTQLEPDVIAKSALANVFATGGGVDVKVSLQIDPNAVLVACEPVVPTEASLANEACGIAARLKFDGLIDPAGEPVTYVTERKIRLIPDNAAPAQR